MPKIALVGAGSRAFARRLLTDIVTWPSLQDATLSLMDLNEVKLDSIATLARKMVKQQGIGATVESSTDLKTAITDADYVVTSIRASTSRYHVSIPAKYGISQAVGDTSGPGGVFYFLKNAPAMVEIAQTMEQVCPDAQLLNYTNPMVMLCWAISQLSSTKTVGLCHSVQGTAANLAEYIGAPIEEISYWAAGINHMAWYLTYEWNGKDAYPKIWESMSNPDVYDRDAIKFEILKHFGSFVTESSIHMSEYTPYFRRTPEMRQRFFTEKMWGVGDPNMTQEERMALWAKRTQEEADEIHRLGHSDEPIEIERSHEFCTRILNAMETNVPYVFNGNVPNTGLITNLVHDCIVEVPIMVDKGGLHPCHVGDLPPQLAALNRTSLNVQELAVKGFVERDREPIYQAVQMDPLTSSLLTLDQIRAMVDEMFEAGKEDLPF